MTPSPSTDKRSTTNSNSEPSTTETTCTKPCQLIEQSPPPISIGRRFLVAFGWTIFGLLFFYLVMVGFSTITKTRIVARIFHDGWARTASRQTASVSTVVFAKYLVSDKSHMSSLKWAIFLGCATFCHVVIVVSDVRAYGDPEVLQQMFRKEKTHMIMGAGPLQVMPILGTIGWLCVLVIINERVYGNALRHRSKQLPAIATWACRWLVLHNSVYYVERLIWALSKQSKPWEYLYPIIFLLLLFASATYDKVSSSTLPPPTVSTAKKSQ